MRIVYMGTPEFAVPALNSIIEAGHDVLMVVTQPDRRGNRGKVVFSPVKVCALEHNIKVSQPNSIKNEPEFIDELRSLHPDIIVVAAFGQILPQDVLDIPVHGCINIHGSILPEYRGAAPMQYAILEGKTETGVTIMQMEKGLDTGDIISLARVNIDRKDIIAISKELAECGAKLVVDTMELIEKGQATYTKQDDSSSSYAHMISKEDGYTDFSTSAIEIDNKVRAFKAWPGTYTNIGDKTLKLFKVLPIEDVDSDAEYGTVTSINKDNFTVKCNGGTLEIREVQLQGKKRMNVSDFLRGNKLEIGMRLK
ncbi:methionyl-tRNA formyltransferase [Mogibacterium pumilum]|uniref:Methionyl-tRNA formyltransferase n=1 Tax=Mogibacterium pumilum TaxID=86332 RepID=A0A223ASW5_9FIRM|nr:methionyl-tRNA formyltransferase [Mogibacterium pumilum]ASS38062.1 methionyl-tRNA formyltransferase [Mogibacterium pumilum]